MEWQENEGRDDQACVPGTVGPEKQKREEKGKVTEEHPTKAPGMVHSF